MDTRISFPADSMVIMTFHDNRAPPAFPDEDRANSPGHYNIVDRWN